MKKVKWILLVLVSLVILYLGLGYLLDGVIFREKIPEISSYFVPGDMFQSDEEGFTQRVIKQENGMVFCELIIAPYAPGPPKHVHTGFDEILETGEDGLYMILENDTVFIEPFQTYVIKKGVPHKPFNPTGKTITVTMKEWGFPEEFAFGLVQMYGYMDQKPLNERSVGDILMQLSRFTKYFDSWAVELAPPVPVQKVLYFFLRPVARLKGYRIYYPEFDVQR